MLPKRKPRTPPQYKAHFSKKNSHNASCSVAVLVDR